MKLVKRWQCEACKTIHKTIELAQQCETRCACTHNKELTVLYGSALYWNSVTLQCDECQGYISGGDADVHCDNKEGMQLLKRLGIAKTTAKKKELFRLIKEGNFQASS